jgi:hypothetical protein
MARTVTQVERVDGERSLSLDKSISVVDRFYRLQPADLGEAIPRPRKVTVRSVGTQGIERPLPVLYFEGVAKPLVLDAPNVDAITHIAGSPLQHDWLGQTVVLAAVGQGNNMLAVRIFAPGDSALKALHRKSVRAEHARARSIYIRQATRAAFLFAGLIAAGIVAIFVIENWAMLLEAVLSAVDALRNSS